jgi:hypothetical protein
VSNQFDTLTTLRHSGSSLKTARPSKCLYLLPKLFLAGRESTGTSCAFVGQGKQTRPSKCSIPDTSQPRHMSKRSQPPCACCWREQHGRSAAGVMKHLLRSDYVGLRGVAAIAAAIGAVAVGAFAIGALSIRRLAIRRVVIDHAEIESLAIRSLKLPSDRGTVHASNLERN